MQQQAAFEFNAAKARADAGMTSAARHAEQDAPGWCEIAAAEIHRYAIAVFPCGFTIEEARAAVEHKVPPPDELRAWGAVTRVCKARKYIEPRQGQMRAATSSNGSPKQVYGLGSAH